MGRAWFGKTKEIAWQIDAEMIDAVEDPRLKEILRLRFIQRKTVSEIAREIHYDTRHVYRLLIKAAAAVKERSSNNEDSERVDQEAED